MSEQDFFKSARADFTFAAASGGAIRHLADLGYTVKQITEQLSFPTPCQRVQKAVRERLLETGVLLLEEPGSGRGLLVKRDYRKLLAIARRTGKLLLAFHRHYDRAAREYEEKMTAPENWSAWKEYLKEK